MEVQVVPSNFNFEGFMGTCVYSALLHALKHLDMSDISSQWTVSCRHGQRGVCVHLRVVRGIISAYAPSSVGLKTLVRNVRLLLNSHRKKVANCLLATAVSSMLEWSEFHIFTSLLLCMF